LSKIFCNTCANERGQSDNTAKTTPRCSAIHGMGGKAKSHRLEIRRTEHLMDFCKTNARETRPLPPAKKESAKKISLRRLSGESVYLEIAALRAFYKFAENEKFLPANPAENLSLPRRWKRLPKALSNDEIKKLLEPRIPKRRKTCATRRFWNWPTHPVCACPN